MNSNFKLPIVAKIIFWIIAVIQTMSSGAVLAQELNSSRNMQADAYKFRSGALEFERYVLKSGDGPSIEYFISHPKNPSPLVLYIQGSGCAPVFISSGTDDYASTVFSYVTTAIKGNYAVMIVNKPFAPKVRPEGEGTALSCPKEFNDYFSLKNWAGDLRIALNHAFKLPWVDSKRSLVIGISEGATVASELAATDERITNVALLGGTGPTQLYDFTVAAYKNSSGDVETVQKLAEISAIKDRILASPESSKDFAWGHTYKRWSGFLKASSTRNLLNSRASVYLVSGMQDTSVPILSTESLFNELQMAGHDIYLRRIPNAAHNLLKAGGTYADVASEYDQILTWFDNNKK